MEKRWSKCRRFWNYGSPVVLHQGLLNYPWLFIESQIFVCSSDGGCLFARVRHPYDCLPTPAGSPEVERMDFFDQRRGGERGLVEVTLQPPSTLCTWAHSVMKWPVSWRPYLNNGPIQLREKPLSGPGWIRYLRFRAAVILFFRS